MERRPGDEPLETTLDNTTLKISLAADGTVVAIDADGTEHNATRLIWFAWFNFHPTTERV